MKLELLDQTIETIQELKGERQKLASEVEQAQIKLAHLQKAQDVAFQLLDKGTLPVEYVQEKLAEFNSKSTEELDLIEKAASMVDGGHLISSQIGKLSEVDDINTLDPITQCLLEDDY